MFNLFNKKNDHPVTSLFSNCTVNQKMSLINFLLTIISCDTEKINKYTAKRIELLNTNRRVLEVDKDKCMTYLESHGIARTLSDLRSISENQKEYLIVAGYNILTCDGSASENEADITLRMFDDIGVSDIHFEKTIKKTQALMKDIYGE